MGFDIRPLQQALGALRFTTPLKELDPTYVERPDGLGRQILDRITAPTTHRLLIGGPAGCGKSTELLQVRFNFALGGSAVFVCPCDRDLDLYRFDPVVFVQYLLWRMASVITTEHGDRLKLTHGILEEVRRCLHTEDIQINNPRMFFSRFLESSKVTPADHELYELYRQDAFATFSRLLAEIQRANLPVLLLIDGLEKVPPTLSTDNLGGIIRSPMFDECQSVFVVPSWTLYGWGSMEQYPDTEVLRIAVEQEPSFVRAVVERRAGDVFTPEALDALASYSGGVVRDGLQIASTACRKAMSERSSAKITRAHVDHARDVLRQSFQSMISDEPAEVTGFLHVVASNGQLPGEPRLRNRLLANGIVLPNPDGTFRVHPCAPI